MKISDLISHAAPLPYRCVGNHNTGITLHGTLPNGSDTDALATFSSVSNDESTAHFLCISANLVPRLLTGLTEAISAMDEVCGCGKCAGCKLTDTLRGLLSEANNPKTV